MSYIDLDDVKAFLDDKITEFEHAKSVLPHGDLPVFSTGAVLDQQAQLLASIRKELEWIEVNGYTPKHPEPGKLDALTDDYAGGAA